MKKNFLSSVSIFPLCPTANARAASGTNHNVSVKLSNQIVIAFAASKSYDLTTFFKAHYTSKLIAANNNAFKSLLPHLINVTIKTDLIKTY